MPEPGCLPELDPGTKCPVCFVHNGGHDQDTHLRLDVQILMDINRLGWDTLRRIALGQAPLQECSSVKLDTREQRVLALVALNARHQTHFVGFNDI